jgi:undecaprenyl-diphosphatase
VAVAVVLLVVSAQHASSITATEQSVFDFFNTLPDWLLPVFNTVYRLSGLWAVALVVGAALFGRRWRLARDLFLAGLLAWGFGRLLGQIVVEGASFGHSLGEVARLGTSPAFPAVRLALLTAVVRAARPYVTRPTRRVGTLLVIGCALAPMYLGNAYPNDVFAGLVLGWAVAAAVHLAFGSPGGRPTSEQVRRSVAELGIDAADVRLASRQLTGSTLMTAEDRHGPVRIKVIGRDEADAQFLAKFWRFIVYRDSGPALAWTRLQQVEHEAFLMLLAQDRGVRVPSVLAAGTAGPRAALLVLRPVAGAQLSDLDPSAVDDAVVAETWRQVAALHAGHLVHGQLDADHVVVGPDGPYLVGFAAGSSSARARRVAVDVAQLLGATAGLVGERRAVEAAAATLGRQPVLDALPFLQAPVLTRATRQQLAARHGQVRRYLGQLRATAGEVLGVEPPEPVQLQRIRGSSLALAIGTLVAAGVLLSDVGEPSMVLHTFGAADWSWLALAFVASFASNVGFAVGLQGTVPLRLPLWPTTELQVAMSFSNLAVPGIGGTGMQVRFLQKRGIDLSSAVAAGGLLSTIGNLAAAVLLFALALVVEPAHVDLSLLPTTGLVELTLYTGAAIGVAAAIIGGVPRVRRAVMPPVVRAASTIWLALRSPRQVALLLGGNVAATLLATWCLVACLLAFGGHVSFWPLLAANIGVITIAQIVPIPGGGTAVGTVGLSAVLVAFGVREDIAVATALANQLIYFYVPAIPGWFATRHLARHDYL